MAYRPRFNSRKREALWQREVLAAHLAGRGLLPICNLCGEPVAADEPWHESHDPAQPRVFGGKSVGIAHGRCNVVHGATVVRAAVAKCDRVHDRHAGTAGPGLGRYPMRAGRRSPFTKTFRHGVQPRLTASQKHAAMIAARYPLLPTR